MVSSVLLFHIGRRLVLLHLLRDLTAISFLLMDTLSLSTICSLILALPSILRLILFAMLLIMSRLSVPCLNMQLPKSEVMATKFKINEYAGEGLPRQLDLPFNDTVQGQSDSVRGILQRFAREGVVNAPQSKDGQFAAQFSDDVPLDSETVNNLMEMDDLSGMDEMEIHDYIRDNTDIIDPSKINNSDEIPGDDSHHANVNPGNNEFTDNQ